MNWLTGTLVYIMVWWLVWFILLPVGVQRDDNPSPMHSTGAPKEIRLKKKFWATTFSAAVVTGCTAYIILKYYPS